MKLCDVTSSILDNFKKNNVSVLGPVPNVLTWMSLAKVFNENIEKNNTQPEDNDNMYCWLWRSNRTKLHFLVQELVDDHISMKITIQIRRFAYYMHSVECDREQLKIAYDSMKKKPKMFLHSSCKNPYCFNPEHLFESFTSFDPSRPPHDIPLGEKCQQSKLKEHEVIKIYTSKDKGSVIAKQYGVSTACVSNIKSRRTWKHLNLPPIKENQ